MIHTSWTISTLSSLPDHPHAPLTHKKKGKKSFRVAVGGARGVLRKAHGCVHFAQHGFPQGAGSRMK